MLLLDGLDRVLLLRWADPARPDRGMWWITPGGGLDDGEGFAEAAVRELFEETGLRLDVTALSDMVLERDFDTEIDGRAYHQYERFFVARVERHEVDTSGFSEIEVACMSEHRWWTLADLDATAERLSPADLPALLRRVAC